MDLPELLLAIRKVAGQEKFETLKPMREVYDLAGQAMDRLKAFLAEHAESAEGAKGKQLVIVEVPELLSGPTFEHVYTTVSSRLQACGIAHELLLLDGGKAIHFVEGNSLEADPSRGAAEPGPAPGPA